MGIHVSLAVCVQRVSDATWRDIYEKARRVASEWSPRPLSPGWRQIGTIRVPQYGLEIETKEGLEIVGDAETLLTAQRFVFPARLEPLVWPDEENPKVPLDEDVLLAVGRWSTAETSWRVGWRDLFGARTQGLPYHTLIVALGLLVEHSLPGSAVVFGDISVQTGERARRGVASILGEELGLPVIVEPERLRRRLAVSMRGGKLEEACRLLGPWEQGSEGTFGVLLALLAGASCAGVREDFADAVLSCRDPECLSIGTRQLLREIVEVIRSNTVRWRIHEQIRQLGGARAREELARLTLAGGMCLTSMAWDAIEVANPDELAFLYTAVSMDIQHPEVHQMMRALVENRVMRRV